MTKIENPEPGTRNLEPGTRNLEPGTYNVILMHIMTVSLGKLWFNN
jgi:hypothetical protein